MLAAISLPELDGVKPLMNRRVKHDLERAVLLGNKFTYSKARHWSSDEQSLTQPMRGPAPVVHLQDNCFPN